MTVRRLLWIDCAAGAAVGTVVLILHPWLSELFALPVGLVLLMGLANLVYASYSFSLAVRRVRPMSLIVLLVVANGAWALLCVRWAVAHAGTASALGMLQLMGEATFVGGLAGLEWRHRERLRLAP